MGIESKATKSTVKKYLGDYIIWVNKRHHVFTIDQRESMKKLIEFWNNRDMSVEGLRGLKIHHDKISENKGCDVLWVRYLNEYIDFAMSRHIARTLDNDAEVCSMLGHTNHV